jgi:hypothetical protein
LFPLFANGVIDTGGAPSLANISANFQKITLLLFLGAWVKVIHEKNLKQKSRDTVPLIAYLIGKGVRHRAGGVLSQPRPSPPSCTGDPRSAGSAAI